MFTLKNSNQSYLLGWDCGDKKISDKIKPYIMSDLVFSNKFGVAPIKAKLIGGVTFRRGKRQNKKEVQCVRLLYAS